MGDARSRARGRALGQECADLGDHIGVFREPLHVPRFAAHVHQANADVRAGYSLERPGAAQRADVVDHARTGGNRGAHHGGLARID